MPAARSRKALMATLQTLRFYFLAISVKKNTSATEIRGDSRAKKSKAMTKQTAQQPQHRFAGNIFNDL